MSNCDGFCLDYCTEGRHRWHDGISWEEPKWLCDRHYEIYKEAEDGRRKRVNFKAKASVR